MIHAHVICIADRRCRHGLPLVLNLAVVGTPCSHVQQGLDQQSLGQELGSGQEAGKVSGTGCAGDGRAVGVTNPF